ncbi:DUF4424 family protein [Tabrizicola aquatica]|uniref:DUF4424 family protein n=1 Tax=Tabrizicola aquatica TaxID=909926 RepID=UPI000CD13F51|nr:DUF4424 family protein [Tabrizicola aquatica]
MRLPLLLAVLSYATPACPDPIFGGLTSTGLQFDQTEAVALIEQDLRIDPDRITVDYLFRNLTAADVTGEVIFPLPAIEDMDWIRWPRFSDGLPPPEQLVAFSLTVNGQETLAAVQLAAVLPSRGPPTILRQTDPPYSLGRDVTAHLQRLGLPVSVDKDVLKPAILALSEGAVREAVALGLLDAADQNYGRGYPRNLWSLSIRHHWTQTFPAGQDVRISISYRNLMDGMLFDAASLPASLHSADAARYCVDDTAFARVASTVRSDSGQVWSVSFSRFILLTAKSWAGPIGRFRLTIDTTDPSAFAFACLDGMIQTGPMTQLWERTDFRPDRDLEIAFVKRETPR